MLNIPGIIRRLSLMLFFAGFGIPAAAAGADIQWNPETVKGGFIVKLPAIDNEALVSEIAALKIELVHNKKLLSQQAEQKRFKDKDTLLATLMPGGLIYAAYKKNAHAKAVQDYELASSRLKEITTDLATLTTIKGPIIVARTH